ncbi:MAG: hypothetical protein HY908_16250 [Myxococcales bacterium]|nr:hypothetical protein [Myxococcales bacterium]
MKATRLAAIGLIAALLGGCAAKNAAPHSGATTQGYGPAQPSEPAAYGGQGAPSGFEQQDARGPSPAAAPPAAHGEIMAGASGVPASEVAKASPAPTQQPGLATSWGETLSSQVTSAPFARADREHPFVTASLYYNDAEGTAALSDIPASARMPRSLFPVHNGFIEVGLRDGTGNFLNGFSANQDNFVTGRAGDRYTIFVRNHSPGRVEAVVSVDGLDVIDGKAASFTKRGYLLDPNGSLEIEGFRQSENAVAAFRFGSVRDSYAALKHGDTRNVGVIGAAFFHERGDNPWTWTNWREQDVLRRQNANPFPGQYATPPN